MKLLNTDLKQRIATIFLNEFNSKPLTFFSPGRINLIGEHTDYNEGFVFPAAIDKGIICTIGKSTNPISRVIAADLNETIQFSANNVDHTKIEGWQIMSLGLLKKFGKKES